MYILCRLWEEKQGGVFPNRTKKIQREELMSGDRFETASQAIEELARKVGNRVFGNAKYPEEAIKMIQFIDEGCPCDSFVDYQLSAVVIPGHESVEPMGDGIAMVHRQLPQTIGEIHIRYYIVHVEDDVDIINGRKEMLSLISDMVKEKGLNIWMDRAHRYDEYGESKDLSTTPAVIHITPQPAPFGSRYMDRAAISLYKKDDELCVKFILNGRSYPLSSDSRTKSSVTWYENIPQKHTNYLFSDENKQKIVSVLTKKL